MKKLICDRCGFEGELGQVYTLKDWEIETDLCIECHKAFYDWVRGEGNDNPNM